MRVVFVNKYAAVTGGGDRHAIGLAHLLSERGHDVRFLAFRPQDDFAFDGEYIDAQVTHDTRETLGRGEAFKAAASMIWNRQAAAAMRRLIAAERPDLVHIHKIYPQLSIAPAVVAARVGLPIVQDAADYEFVSADPYDESGGKVDHSSTRLAYRVMNTASFGLRRRFHLPKVTRWIVASRFMQSVHARAGIDASLLPYFLPDLDSGVGPSYDDRRGAVFLGRLVPAKGIRDVVEVARRHPRIPVRIAGSGEQEGYVRRMAETLPNLRFEGYLDAVGVNRVLARSRVALMPSRWQEPAGLAALEAMLQGTPVVAYACGGLADYVASNGGGTLVGEGDVTALADAAEGLHEDRQRWTELSARGRAGVRSNHDPARYVERLERIYAEAAHAG